MTIKTPTHILVPLDFSEPSMKALEAAKMLAKRFEAFLDLVYVQAIPISLSGFHMEGDPLAVPGVLKQMEEFRRWKEEKMREALVGFPAKKAQVRVLQGWPADMIRNYSQGKEAAMVVMGTHGYAGLDRAIFGSVAESVVRHAVVPVMTLHGQTDKFSISKILVPYNLEPYADAALAHAAFWADHFKANMTVLQVLPPDISEEDARGSLRKRLESLFANRAPKRMEILFRQGDPRQEIMNVAVGGKFDLIALSAHRKPFLKEYVLGSTAERVLRHSPVPVLSIPSSEKTGRGSTKKASGPWASGKIF